MILPIQNNISQAIFCIYRLITNIVFIVLFYVFGFVKISCGSGICDSYEDRNDILLNSMLFTLLIFTSAVWGLGIVPFCWYYITNNFTRTFGRTNIDTSNSEIDVTNDHNFATLFVVRDWQSVAELVLFGYYLDIKNDIRGSGGYEILDEYILTKIGHKTVSEALAMEILKRTIELECIDVDRGLFKRMIEWYPGLSDSGNGNDSGINSNNRNINFGKWKKFFLHLNKTCDYNKWDNNVRRAIFGGMIDVMTDATQTEKDLIDNKFSLSIICRTVFAIRNTINVGDKASEKQSINLWASRQNLVTDVKCPYGHNLRRREVPGGAYTVCNKCKEAQNYRETIFSCKPCEYDVCPQCFAS